MGQSFAVALDFVEREFVRVQNSQQQQEGTTTTVPSAGKNDDDDPYATLAALKTNITYPMVRKISIPETIRVNLRHVAIAYCLDGNQDGLYSIDDLTNFVKWVYQEVPADIAAEDFAEVVQAKATLRMWRECRQKAAAERGESAAVSSSAAAAAAAADETAQAPEAPTAGTTPQLQAEDDEAELHDAAAVHFVKWMMLFLERNFPPVTASASAPQHPPSTAPRPPQHSELPTIVSDEVRRQASLPGTVMEDDMLGSINSFNQSSIGLVHPPVPPLPPLQCPSRDLMSPRDGEIPWSAASHTQAAAVSRWALGLDAIACIYQLLNVRESYGMSFHQFCRVLSSSGVPRGQAQKSPLAEPQLPVPIWVSRMALVPLLTSFIRSYWRILSRLGLTSLLV
jgi:hypothetical protein